MPDLDVPYPISGLRCVNLGQQKNLGLDVEGLLQDSDVSLLRSNNPPQSSIQNDSE